MRLMFSGIHMVLMMFDGSSPVPVRMTSPKPAPALKPKPTPWPSPTLTSVPVLLYLRHRHRRTTLASVLDRLIPDHSRATPTRLSPLHPLRLIHLSVLLTTSTPTATTTWLSRHLRDHSHLYHSSDLLLQKRCIRRNSNRFLTVVEDLDCLLLPR